ncbi:MAG: hypothetical protein ACRC33_27000 [Gemmataceae bacterium]
MSDDPIDRLSGFSPSPEGLDRDALLFEAGRASAPPDRRGWAVAGVLALALTFTLLTGPPPPPAAPPPAAPPTPERRFEARPLTDEPPVEGLSPDGTPLRPIDHTTFTTLE